MTATSPTEFAFGFTMGSITTAYKVHFPHVIILLGPEQRHPPISTPNKPCHGPVKDLSTIHTRAATHPIPPATALNPKTRRLDTQDQILTNL